MQKPNRKPQEVEELSADDLLALIESFHEEPWESIENILGEL